ncbi:hypothetical protein BDW02DRAFT_566584 [Decorospora gaudefroyi]|uniref:Uncharacterized protein n=1 Tax=Decorospora gaudefroyi TaxID=184978 RepID=A0A6A5KME7_9PLEO|nr:hypothetical protein BDW02DRAFT_566584 [Decorospora gaudefroyi]
MCPAHTCFRSALTQAFRPNTPGIAASCSVPAFLVPALGRHPQRSFSSTPRRSEATRPIPDAPKADANDATVHKHPPKPKERLESGIPYPRRKARGDIEAWLVVIDPFLPGHLQREPSDQADVPVTSVDLALVLNTAQDASVDILSHLGLVEGRWQTVVWIVKKLAEHGRRPVHPSVQLAHIAKETWPGSEHRTLKELTEGPLRIERERPLHKLALTLDVLTSVPESISYQHSTVKRALGQMWRSLGNMILVATEPSFDGQDTIMPRVLEMIAHLHHLGLIPDSVYTFHPHEHKYALQQPPTIHIFSSKILTALSDATWNAHEASVKTAKERANVQYFLGHEIPGSRFKIRVTQIVPELWLELVLWSCLHGGWILDGAAILRQLALREREHSWTLISWRELLEAEQQKMSTPKRAWSLFPRKEDSASASDRVQIRKTISGEVITAFIDGLVNEMRLGVGARGTDPENLVASIKILKNFLDRNNLSLGSAAWDAIMARLLESGGFVPEKRPELLLRIFELAPGFGAEVGAANASAAVGTEVPYFFEPTTIPLSLLHRAMRAFIQNGDVQGATTTLSLLQRHTDDNKQKSMQQFFKFLKSRPQSSKDEPFTSRLPPVDFPAFDLQMPITLLARLLDLVTEAKSFDLGRWLLFSEDLDGPLISSRLYSHRNIAASIVRFSTLAGENDLVLRIINLVGTWNENSQQQRMPAEILIALLCCQVKLRRWESVRGIQNYVEGTSRFKPRSIIISTFAAELLRTSNDPDDAKVQAQEAFTGLLFGWEKLILENLSNELYCTLAIMSTVGNNWKKFCSSFLAFSSRQAVKLSTDDFNRVLGGVLDGYGSAQGKAIVEKWCFKPPKTFEPYRAPGGLPTMPRYRVTKGEQYEDRPEDIELVQDSGTRLTLHGRVYPNRQTIYAIIQKVREEVVQEQTDFGRRRAGALAEVTRAEVRDTLKWAARLLYYLGFDYEDIIRDLGSLAELAELEAPQAAGDTGHVEGIEQLDQDV